MVAGELQQIGELAADSGANDVTSATLTRSATAPRALSRTMLEELKPKAAIAGEALVLRAELRTDRNGSPYAALALRGMDGSEFVARWWQFPYPASECPTEGAIFHFTGVVDSFNGNRQVRVTDARPLFDADLSVYARSTHRSSADLVAQLDTLVAALDSGMAALVRSVLSGETYMRFCSWPAAQRHHGAVRHGLLAHSVRVAELADRLADCYGSDDLPCDRSLLVAAALLHDIGKVRTLPPIAGSALPEVSTYFDHVTLGALLIKSAADHLDSRLDAARLDALLHAVVSHHGRKDWGAPTEPASVEAWLVHVADLAESRLWPFSLDGRA